MNVKKNINISKQREFLYPVAIVAASDNSLKFVLAVLSLCFVLDSKEKHIFRKKERNIFRRLFLKLKSNVCTILKRDIQNSRSNAVQYFSQKILIFSLCVFVEFEKKK